MIYADEGELLIYRNLKVQWMEEDNWMRHTIFHRRCTSHGKVCDLIIDGGNYENVVSANMVDKLQLKVEDHPHPYGLIWLEQKRGKSRLVKDGLFNFQLVRDIRMKFYVMLYK